MKEFFIAIALLVFSVVSWLLLKHLRRSRKRIYLMAFNVGEAVGFVITETITGKPLSLVPSGNYTPTAVDENGASVTLGTTTLLADVTLANGLVVPAGTTVYAITAPTAAETVTVSFTGTDNEGNALSTAALVIEFDAVAPVGTTTASAFVLPSAPVNPA